MKLARTMFATLAAVALMSAYGCGKSASPTSATGSLDTTPPGAPEGLAMMSVPEFNELTWTPSTASDLATYQVYQYQPDPSRDNAYVLLGETTSPSFRLTMTGDGAFRVKAVDTSGNRSAFSSELTTTVPAIMTGGGSNGNPGSPGRKATTE